MTTLESVLAGVAREHEGCKVLRSCGCGLRGLARPLPDPGEFEAAYAAHLAAEQAKAVGVWLDGQRETVAEAIEDALSDSHSGRRDMADAAIAAIRSRISEAETGPRRAEPGPGPTHSPDRHPDATGREIGPQIEDSEEA